MSGGGVPNQSDAVFSGGIVSGVSTLSTPGAASAACRVDRAHLAGGNRALDEHGVGEPFELLLDRVFCGAGDLGRAVDARQPPTDGIGAAV